MRLLIDAAASLDTACPDGEIPLITAVRAGHASVVELLLASGGTRTLDNCLSGHAYFTPLYLAASDGNVEIVRLLISWGARLKKTSAKAPLSTAARHGHHEVVSELLIAGLRDDSAFAAARAAGHPLVLCSLKARQLCITDG